MLQVIHGFLQLTDVLPSYLEDFKLGGSYGNPGLYANYLVAVLPLALGIWLSKNGNSAFGQALKVFSIIVFTAIIAILPVTKARTSWIAAIVGIVFIVNHRYSIAQKILLKLKRPVEKISVLLAGLALIFLVSYKLYHFKEGSSSGRMFIWETTLNIIEKKPVFGTGFNTFKNAHNTAQAEYFRAHPNDTKTAYLADNVIFAFNDYLEMASETGIIGLFLFLSVIFFVFQNVLFKKKSNLEKESLDFSILVSLVVILVTAIFSYPFRSVGVNLFFIVYIAILSAGAGDQVFTIKINNSLFKPVLVLLIILFGHFLSLEVSRCKANVEWGKAVSNIQKGNYERAFQIYNNIYPKLQYSGNFLYNYGAELSILGKYKEGLEILNQCENKINDADFYTYLGNTYEGLNRLNEAETAFLQASYIIPHKLYPFYRLAIIYAKKNDMHRALEMARLVLAMKPKVESDVTRHIKADMEQFINLNKELL